MQQYSLGTPAAILSKVFLEKRLWAVWPEIATDLQHYLDLEH